MFHRQGRRGVHIVPSLHLTGTAVNGYALQRRAVVISLPLILFRVGVTECVVTDGKQLRHSDAARPPSEQGASW